MIASHVHIFHEHKIPLNTPDDVAAFTQYVAASEKVNGQNVYIGGGRGFDIEDGLARTMPEWLGQENLDGWALQAKAFGQVSSALLLSETMYGDANNVVG